VKILQLLKFNITRPVENVVITPKGLQDRKPTVRWKDGGK
jgi:hypothetical protein